MAVNLFYDALILHGSVNVSADHNEVKLEQKADIKDVTRFGHTTHINAATLRGLEAEGKGWVQFDDSVTPMLIDGTLYPLIGAASKAYTLAESTPDGATAYVGKTTASDYSVNLKNDEIGMFEFKVKCSEKFTRGRLILPLTSRVASGTGTIYQLGALSASQILIANLHVTAFDGSTLDVVVKSNDTNNTTTPTSRITFAQATGVTSEFKTVSGAITDTYWYVDFTFTGNSFTAAVAAGIK